MDVWYSHYLLWWFQLDFQSYLRRRILIIWERLWWVFIYYFLVGKFVGAWETLHLRDQPSKSFRAPFNFFKLGWEFEGRGRNFRKKINLKVSFFLCYFLKQDPFQPPYQIIPPSFPTNWFLVPLHSLTNSFSVYFQFLPQMLSYPPYLHPQILFSYFPVCS